MQGPSITVDNLSLQYDDNIILDGITTSFEAGQCHVIMGPNGGGKTSLLRSILGLTPFSGSVEIKWLSETRIGYVPQKATFEPSLPLTVMDFVLLNQTRMPLFWRKQTKQHQLAQAQLERVGMETRSERRMGQLSGGEQQRVLFAQALLDNPSFLVLDEPTTGMDEQGVRYLESLIRECVSEGKTILAVHHDVSAVRRLDANVHVVNRFLVESGHHEQVLHPSKIESLFQHYTSSPHSNVMKASSKEVA